MSEDTAVAKREATGLVAHGTEWQAIQEQARTLIASGFMPRAVNTPAKAIAVMLAGRELGLPPMQSIRAVNIVDGKPTLSAETMLALAYQRVPGLVVEVVTTVDGAMVIGNRPGGKPVTVGFSKANAAAAGLLNKDNWRKYPEAMYRARAISAWCRVVCPDAILGAYTPEELEPARTAWPTERAAAPVIDILGGEQALDDPRPTQEEAVDAQDAPPAATADALISEPQRKRLYAISKVAQKVQNWPDDALTQVMTGVLKKRGYASTKDIRRSDYQAICDEVESWK